MQTVVNKQRPREIYLYHKTNQDSIKQDIIDLMNSPYFSSANNKTVDQLWTKFKDTILNSMRLHIPHKLTRTRNFP